MIQLVIWVFMWIKSNAHALPAETWRTSVIITSSFRQNDAATPFWRNNDGIIACPPFHSLAKFTCWGLKLADILLIFSNAFLKSPLYFNIHWRVIAPVMAWHKTSIKPLLEQMKPSSLIHIHWNLNVIFVVKLSPLPAPEVVNMTISVAASDKNFMEMALRFQCMRHQVSMY